MRSRNTLFKQIDSLLRAKKFPVPVSTSAAIALRTPALRGPSVARLGLIRALRRPPLDFDDRASRVFMFSPLHFLSEALYYELCGLRFTRTKPNQSLNLSCFLLSL
jgi:hypothetical protein